MKLDLHVHSKEGSDGRWPLEQIMAAAKARGLGLISISDHDSILMQARARELALARGIGYLSGVELNVTMSLPDYNKGKPTSLDFLGYGFDIENAALKAKLLELQSFRVERAKLILENLNVEFRREGLREFSAADLEAIQATVDGTFGRPHIADYLVNQGIVANRQEAFDRYLVRCNVDKLPLSLEEASSLVRGAGGKLFLAHPSDPNGTSLKGFSEDLAVQLDIIENHLLGLIDGLECWHSRLNAAQTEALIDLASKHALMVSGGSDCHQNPLLLGSVDVPEKVADQFLNYSTFVC